MCSLSGPKAPPLPEAPAAPPREVDRSSQDARLRKRNQARAALGQASTRLTGNRGLQTEANVQRKSALGQ